MTAEPLVLYPRRGVPTGYRWHYDGEWTAHARRRCESPNVSAWRGYGLEVLADRIEAEYRGVVGPQIHVSVAVKGHARRASDEEMALVRRDFDVEDGEEDNHSPGKARHLFLPLHLPRGTTGLCECKADEETIVEPDGYVWQKPRA